MKVGNEIPINKTAALVMSRGESFEFKVHESNICSPYPLPTVPIHHNEIDLTGLRIGRLMVIGKSEKAGLWVCRCVCGNYALKRTKPIKIGTASACDQCWLMAAAKRNEYFQRTGIHRHAKDFL